jgi:hypothetical protein
MAARADRLQEPQTVLAHQLERGNGVRERVRATPVTTCHRGYAEPTELLY